MKEFTTEELIEMSRTFLRQPKNHKRVKNTMREMAQEMGLTIEQVEAKLLHGMTVRHGS
jgi:hypothetical protein